MEVIPVPGLLRLVRQVIMRRVRLYGCLILLLETEGNGALFGGRSTGLEEMAILLLQMSVIIMRIDSI